MKKTIKEIASILQLRCQVVVCISFFCSLDALRQPSEISLDALDVHPEDLPVDVSRPGLTFASKSHGHQLYVPRTVAEVAQVRDELEWVWT